jgi:hypothetical protein
MTHLSPACLLAVVALLSLAVGCNEPVAPPKPAAPPAKVVDDHDHDHGDHADHAHPETLAAGLAELTTSVADVAVKLTTGAKDAADDAVHDIGHLLGDLEGVLEKHDVSADLKEVGRKALAELTDCFDKIDQSLHAAEGEGESPAAVYASVTERIAAAMKSLGELIAGEKDSKEGT